MISTDALFMLLQQQPEETEEIEKPEFDKKWLYLLLILIIIYLLSRRKD